MRQLEVVSVSDDGTRVLLAARQDGRATHQLIIDARLLAAVKGELDTSGPRQSELSPKEIQARLRAGETPEQVAKAAKVPVSRVNRFAGPVISERERILDQARASPMHRGRGPAATTPLGELVAKRLGALTGLRPESVEWSASRREDGAWTVTLGYTARGGSRSASWLWQPATHELTALDAAGSRLAAEPTTRPRSRAARSAPARSRGTTVSRPATGRRSRRAPAATIEPEAAPIRRPRIAAQTLERAAAAAPEPVERRNGRVPVPSWSDVLFGVQAPEAPVERAPQPKPRTRAAAPRSASSSARGRRRS